MALREEVAASARQEDLYRFQLSEIDAARLREGEEDELRAERNRLQHAERIYTRLQEVMGLLHEDDRSAAARLARRWCSCRGSRASTRARCRRSETSTPPSPRSTTWWRGSAS